MDKKSILSCYSNSMQISKALTELGKAHFDSLIKLPKEPFSKQVHFHNVTIKPLSTELKPMSIDEVMQAPVIIQQIYFCALTNTHIGVDQLKEANQKYPKYFIFDER